MRKQSILYKTLARALSVKRPHGGKGVTMFEQWLHDHIPAEFDKFFDGCGNLHVDARKAPEHRTLFVAHIDTVHRTDGANKIRKAHNMWYADGDPLGADDGAGCAMLMHLLHSGVPGYYIFTQGEECGGIGAKFVANNFVDLLKQFDRAIAFDRRGIDSVITHQGWGRCASDTFADALATALNASDDSLMYLPDDTGVYTDTAEFVDTIPECTNISVGYNSEHSQQESLNIHHFTLLSEAVLHVEWDKLPTDRDPTVPDYKSYKYDTGGTAWWTQYDTKANRDLEQSRYFSKWEDDEYWQTEDLLDGLYDAMVGHHDFLLEQISEAVYPEQPDLALRFLDRRLLTDDLLQEALIQARTYDATTVLCTLFDAIHCEA